jgi:hypothetical protein
MTHTLVTENAKESGIFGLRYLEEEEADILDVAGCQSVTEDGDDSIGGSVTYRFCGDWDTDLADVI